MATIFTNALGTPRSDSGQPSFRNVLAITGGAQSQIRVTFNPSAGNTCTLQKASIGISSGTTMITTATPVELLFGGASGFSTTTPITSDWLNFSGFTSSDKLVVIMDYDTSLSTFDSDQTTSGLLMYFLFGEASYNKADPTADGAWGNVPWDVGVSSIETQATGGASPVVGQTPSRIFLPRQGPDKGMRSPKAFPASPISLTLPAAQGTYTLTGQVQTLGVGMPAGQGSYSLTGFAATLSVVPNPVGRTPPRIFRPDSGPHRNMRTAKAFPTIGSNSYTLAASQGAYTLTGFSAILNRGIQMSAAQGSYTLTGRAQTLNRGILISAAQGSYTLNGQAVTPGVGMPAAQGSYALTGQSVTPAVGMPAAQGTYTLTGKPQAFAVALSILPQQGTYSLTGSAVVLVLTPAGGSGVVHSNPFLSSPGAMTAIP